MATDQEIRDAGYKYIPLQKYLLNPFEIPTVEETDVVNEGIVNTNAFNNSGNNNFNSMGNAFGYGTAVRPGDKTTIVGGPYAGQSGYYGSINYSGGLPGDITQKGPGRYFDYGDGNLYKDYTIQPKKELPNWMKAGLAILPGGRFALNFIDNKMNPLGPTTQAEIDEDQAGSYGIAGLSAADKNYYDALAGSGYLFDGPGGMKTLTGKNFAGKGYFEGQMELANQFGFADMTDEEIAAAIEAEKQSQFAKGYNNPGFKYKQMLEASAIYKAEKRRQENQKREFDKPGGTGQQVADLQQEIDSGKYSGGSDFAQSNQAAVGGGNQGKEANTDDDKSTGTAQGYSQHYARGGLASIL